MPSLMASSQLMEDPHLRSMVLTRGVAHLRRVVVHLPWSLHLCLRLLPQTAVDAFASTLPCVSCWVPLSFSQYSFRDGGHDMRSSFSLPSPSPCADLRDPGARSIGFTRSSLLRRWLSPHRCASGRTVTSTTDVHLLPWRAQLVSLVPAPCDLAQLVFRSRPLPCVPLVLHRLMRFNKGLRRESA